MKPFLLLQLRPEDPTSDSEYAAFLEYGGLQEADMHRIRMEKTGVPAINLTDYSGVIMGGGPSNVSDLQEKKTPEQLRFEEELKPLMQQALDLDFPLLGACYGLGYITNYLGGSVSKERYTEPVAATNIHINEEGAKDPLLQGLPRTFRAFVGHKEACQGVPNGAVLLASSDACPVQMIRIGQNVYATQFHPELDQNGMEVRIRTYKNMSYFPPEDAQMLIDAARAETVTVPMKILKRFVERYAV